MSKRSKSNNPQLGRQRISSHKKQCVSSKKKKKKPKNVYYSYHYTVKSRVTKFLHRYVTKSNWDMKELVANS